MEQNKIRNNIPPAMPPRKCSLRSVLILILLILFAYVNFQLQPNVTPPSTTLHSDRDIRSCVELEGKLSSKFSSLPPPAKEIIFDKALVEKYQHGGSKYNLGSIRDFTTHRLDLHLLRSAGREHYALLHYLTSTYPDTNLFTSYSWPCTRHVVDIGTQYVASALALAAARNAPVWTFEFNKLPQRKKAMREHQEQDWLKKLHEKGIGMSLYDVDLTNVSDTEFVFYCLSTWLILVDMQHKPDSIPFERQLIQRLVQHNYQGIVLLDEIKYNAEMIGLWKELQTTASQANAPFRTFDVSSMGCKTGTGVLDFSGRVVVR